LTDGILKILSKMGISTLRSYRGAEIFEALGLDDDLLIILTGTASRIGGSGLKGNRGDYFQASRGIRRKSGPGEPQQRRSLPVEERRRVSPLESESIAACRTLPGE